MIPSLLWDSQGSDTMSHRSVVVCRPDKVQPSLSDEDDILQQCGATAYQTWVASPRRHIGDRSRIKLRQYTSRPLLFHDADLQGKERRPAHSTASVIYAVPFTVDPNGAGHLIAN
jgi:hypothetical protein